MIRTLFVLACLASLLAGQGLARNSATRKPIQLVGSIERGGVRHHIAPLKEHESLRLVIHQFEIDVDITILDPEGHSIARCDNTEWGPEVCFCVARQSGNFKITVRGGTDGPSAGSYRIESEQLGAATPLDQHRLSAQSALERADRSTTLPEATEFAVKADTEARAGGDRLQKAIALGVLSRKLHRGARLAEALKAEQEARSLWQALGYRDALAFSTRELGRIIGRLGDSAASSQWGERAAVLMRSSSDRRLIGTAMGHTTNSLASMRRFGAALTEARRWEQLVDSLGDSSQLDSLLEKQSRILQDLRRFPEVLGVATRLLTRAQSSGNVRAIAAAQGSVGMALSNVGRSREAITSFREAAELHRSTGDLKAAAGKLTVLAHEYVKLGEPDQALRELQTAEALHAENEAGNPLPKWRATIRSHGIGFLQAIRTEALLANGNFEDALLEHDRLKAGAAAPFSITLDRIRTALLDQETVLVKFLLLSTVRMPTVWIVGAQSKVKIVELSDWASIQAQLQICRLAVAERARRINGESAAAFRIRLAGADLRFRRAAARLGRLVISPLAEDIRGKRMIVVPDRDLNGFPIGALPDPDDTSKPLLAYHEIIMLTSATEALQTAQSGSRTGPLVVVADPVFRLRDRRPSGVEGNDARIRDVTRAVGMRSSVPDRLLHSRKEAFTIAALNPETRLLLDHDANRDTLLDGGLSDAHILHFATHGFTNPLDPDLSGLLLSRVSKDGRPLAGFVNFTDIYNLRLNTDLVVLSMCHSAVGRDYGSGEYLSLANAFLHAGARRVIASLWAVDDEATSALMARFYIEYLKNGLGPAAALRAAQMHIAKDPRWKSPYYWAGFTFQGQWKD